MSKNVTSKSKQCKQCGQEFQPNSNSQLYCKPCQVAREKAFKHAKHIRTYVRKGYNQLGEHNNNWKGGKGNSDVYERIAFEVYEKVCMRCGSTKNIVVHHKDRDRGNNDVANLEVLCKKCHQLEHKCENALGKYLGNKNVERDALGRFKRHL